MRLNMAYKYPQTRRCARVRHLMQGYIAVLRHRPAEKAHGFQRKFLPTFLGNQQQSLGITPELFSLLAAPIALMFGPYRAATKALYQSAIGKRSEEHTSELQSRFDLVCCLLLE